MPAFNAFLYLDDESPDGSHLTMNFRDLLDDARPTVDGDRGPMPQAQMAQSCPRLTSVLRERGTTINGRHIACFSMPTSDALGQFTTGEMVMVVGGRALQGHVTAADVEWAVESAEDAFLLAREWARYVLTFRGGNAAGPNGVTFKELADYVEQGVGVLKNLVDIAKALGA